jgi:hypothetical protein
MYMEEEPVRFLQSVKFGKEARKIGHMMQDGPCDENVIALLAQEILEWPLKRFGPYPGTIYQISGTSEHGRTCIDKVYAIDPASQDGLNDAK